MSGLPYDTLLAAPRVAIPWSPQQMAVREWFRSGEGNLLVRARAGAGKTTSVVDGALECANARAPRFAAFMTEPRKDLARRVEQHGRSSDEIVRTLNSVGHHIVSRRKLAAFDEKRGYRLAQQALGGAPGKIGNAVKELAGWGKGALATTSDAIVDAALARGGLDPECEQMGYSLERLAPIAFHAMALSLEDDGTFDFDDQLFLPVVNNWFEARDVDCDLSVTDEAQDCTPLQRSFALGVGRNARMVWVGDDRQNIMSWNGAELDSLDLAAGACGARELPLTVSFRCPQAVVRLAQEIVPDIEARPGAPEGVVEWTSGARILELAIPGAFVLARTNLGVIGTCLHLQQEGRVARVAGRDAATKILSMIWKANPSEDVPSFRRRLDSWERRERERAERRLKSTSSKSRAVAKRRYRQVLDVSESMRTLADGCKDIEQVKRQTEALFAVKGGEQAVVCSTVHQAKGKEADRVILLDDTFSADTDIATEELNVSYVAITRAKRELFILRGDG